MIMDGFKNVLPLIDYTLNTKRKRYITGGILLSISMLFRGLTFTVMTIKNEENDDE